MRVCGSVGVPSLLRLRPQVFAVPLYMPVMLTFILAYSCSNDTNGEALTLCAAAASGVSLA